jgi:hypothetical protein
VARCCYGEFTWQLRAKSSFTQFPDLQTQPLGIISAAGNPQLESPVEFSLGDPKLDPDALPRLSGMHDRRD